MNAVVFICARDVEIGALSAESLRRFGLRVIWCADVSDAPQVAASLPGGVSLVVSDFPRAGNLNGGQCVAGMIRKLAALQGASPFVLKVDADIILVEPTPLFDGMTRGASMVGPSSRQGDMRGGFYAIDARAVERQVCDYCATRSSTIYPEAQLMDAAIQGASLRTLRLPPESMRHGFSHTIKNPVAFHFPQNTNRLKAARSALELHPIHQCQPNP